MYIKTAKIDFRKGSNYRTAKGSKRLEETNGLSEEAYNTLEEFCKSLIGTPFQMPVQLSGHLYEFEFTFDRYELEGKPYGKVYGGLYPSRLVCTSNPGYQLIDIDVYAVCDALCNILRYQGRRRNISTGRGLNCVTLIANNDADVDSIVDEFYDYILSDLHLPKNYGVWSSATLDAARYIHPESVQDNILTQLIVKSLDPQLFDIVEYVSSDIGLGYIEVGGSEGTELHITSDIHKLFESTTVEYPHGVTVADIQDLVNTVDLTLSSNFVRSLYEITVNRVLRDTPHPENLFTLPLGSWYDEDFNYEYTIHLYGSSVQFYLSRNTDPTYPFDSSINMKSTAIVDNLISLTVDYLEQHPPKVYDDVVQALRSVTQNMINKTYNDSQFRKNLRAAFRRRAKSEGVVFGEE